MRRYFAIAAVTLASGCSVDVGAGSIAPVAIDAPVDVGSATPPFSLSVETEFLSADQSSAIAQQYGGKLGAVEAVDVSVQELALQDGGGTPIAGGLLRITYDGVTIDKVGDRVRLPDAARDQVVAAIKAQQAFDVDLSVVVDWSPPTPAAMNAHAVLQPIVVVDGLKAL
jgi:hypothetical protein